MSQRAGMPTSQGKLAGLLFDQGQNCAQAVLQATTGEKDPKLLAMLEGFRGGIADTGCLCGAVTGAVMALGMVGRSCQSAHLVKAFTARFQTTCCRGLSKDYVWLSKKHLANCRVITVETADIAGKLIEGPSA